MRYEEDCVQQGSVKNVYMHAPAGSFMAKEGAQRERYSQVLCPTVCTAADHTSECLLSLCLWQAGPNGVSLLLCAGSAVGVALGTFGLPFVEAAFGTAGVRIALLWDLANVVAGAQSSLQFVHGVRPAQSAYQRADADSHNPCWFLVMGESRETWHCT